MYSASMLKAMYATPTCMKPLVTICHGSNSPLPSGHSASQPIRPGITCCSRNTATLAMSRLRVTGGSEVGMGFPWGSRRQRHHRPRAIQSVRSRAGSRSTVGARSRAMLSLLIHIKAKSIARERAPTHIRGSGGQGRGLQDFNPVAVGILDEGDVLHAAIGQTLLERHAQRLEAHAGRVHVRHRDAQVAETARLAVAVVVLKIRLLLGAVVVGELQDAGLAQHPLQARGIVFGDPRAISA